MVTVWNPADEAQDFVFTLFYSGGHYLHPLHLEPRATLMFNVSQVIHNQLPDSEGNVMPLSVHDGSAEISGPQGENEYILVAMDAGTYNVQKATCGPYCKTCQGAVDSWVAENPFATPLGTNHQLAFMIQSHSGLQNNDASTWDWNSTNTSVATVSTGLVHPVSAGSLDAFVNDADWPIYDTMCSGTPIGMVCPFETGVSGDGSGAVQTPGFLQVVSTTTGSACTNGLGCIREMFYRVLDVHQGAMNISGMNVAETLTTPTGCSGVTVTDAGVWTTDSTGALTAPDNIFACAGSAVTCTLVYKQTFTVNGFPVQILSQDKLTGGLRNTISIAINNGVSTCPVVAITP